MAVTKPTKKPEWATNSENDPITGAPNKLEPPQGFKESGLKRKQPLSRSFLNYNFNLIKQWIDWVEDQINTLTTDGATATLEAVYPVGSYYFNDSDGTNPATLLGIGTWVAVEGRVLVGIDPLDTDFDGAGEQGGSKTHTHTDNFSVDGHALTVSEMPAHAHTFTQENTQGSGSAGAQNGESSFSTQSTSTVGGGQAHTHGLSGGVQSASNLMPYRSCYVWRRTA